MFKKALFLFSFLVLLTLSSSKIFAEEHFGIGVGLTTDNYSVYDSTFTVPVLNLYYEYQISGMAVLALNYVGLNVYFPVLALDAGVVVPVFDELAFKAAFGYFSDLSFNGFKGLMLSGSIIFNKSLELKFIGVPFDAVYGQPRYSVSGGFVDSSFIKNENGLYDIKKGYLGILMCMRF